MKKIISLVTVVALVTLLTGCTSQEIARNFGGTYEITLEPGQELEVITWKDDDLWILTKDRSEDEDPETHRYFADSPYGVFEGEVIIRER